MTEATGNEKGIQPADRRRSPKNSAPIWNMTSLTDFEAEFSKNFQGASLTEQPEGDSDGASDVGRGCHNMTRFARVLAVLSAFGAILMVAGASTKY